MSETHVEATIDSAQNATKSTWSKWKTWLVIGLVIIVLLCIAYFFIPSEGMVGGPALAAYLTGAPQPTTTDNFKTPSKDHYETEDTLLTLARRAKKVGLMLQGTSNCGWSTEQREMFGDRGSEARKVLESIYIECVTSEMCPNVRGFPTWVYKDKQYPGFKSPTALRTLINELESVQPRPMISGPSEPIDEVNIPDAENAVDSGNPGVSVESIRKSRNEAKRDEADAAKSAKSAQLESNRQSGFKGGIGGFDPKDTGGFPPGSRKRARKENVRGVSNFPPLNVPDMPGTQPFVLDMQHTDDQTLQGRVPRAASEPHVPSASIAEQLIRSFDHARQHNDTRLEEGETVANAKYPHATDITTGEPFDDNTIVFKKN